MRYKNYHLSTNLKSEVLTSTKVKQKGNNSIFLEN